MAEDTGREGSQMRGALGARHSLSCHNDFMNSMIRVLQETGSSYPTRFGRATRAILFASEGQLNLHARDAVLYRRWGTWGGRPQGQPGGCHLGLGEEDSRMSGPKGRPKARASERRIIHCTANPSPYTSPTASAPRRGRATTLDGYEFGQSLSQESGVGSPESRARRGGSSAAARPCTVYLYGKPASRAEASSPASCRSSTDLVASTTVGGAVNTIGRREKKRNMLARASTGLEVRLPHLASSSSGADSSRKPAARVRRALPNLTAVEVNLCHGRLVPNHMILAATSIACLGRQHQQQQ